MKKFTITTNHYLQNDIPGYYNCDYTGYQKHGNPDFINRLKNMSNQYSELDLVMDFIQVFETAYRDIKSIISDAKLSDCAIAVIPRSKAEQHYKQSQLLFRKAISCVADKLNCQNTTDALKRVKDTKTTHSWRMEHNLGPMPYKGITKDTCGIDKSKIKDKNIVLVDDIYTKNVYVAEDCIQTLLDCGAKSVILYVIAKTGD